MVIFGDELSFGGGKGDQFFWMGLGFRVWDVGFLYLQDRVLMIRVSAFAET